MPSCDNSSFNQTLFLGLSVQSVSMNMGWNQQQSNITVTLIEDTCKPASGTKKVYYPRPGAVSYWSKADPGFQTPTIGAPVYFRFDDFEFAGIVQSWDIKESSSGQVYSVSIADPRLLLENLTVIISDYADNVGGIPNLINPYGYLESLGYPCAQQFINGASFGSPAGGFGGARNNDQGTPYNLLRDATQALLCGVSSPKFSPYGFARYRGNNPVIGSPSMGIIAADDFDSQVIADYKGNGYGASYLVDISDIPFSPEYFRLTGPQDTLMNMISNVCTLAGCDYYIELLVTPSLTKIIKVRTSMRKAQPTLGVIEGYLATAKLDVINRDVGRELRNENTSSFLYGGYLQTVYEQGEPDVQSEANNNIIQHWGYDAEGILNPATYNAANDEWTVSLDIRPLNLNLKKPLVAGVGNTVDITETEMRLAIGDIEAWRVYSLKKGQLTDLGALITAQYPGLLLDINGVPINPVLNIGNMAGNNNIAALNNNTWANPDSDAAKDLRKIHEFVNNFADELYGKQFLVRLPFVCFQTDSDSGKTVYSDNPTSNGGYPARGVSDVLTLPFPSTGLDFFSSKEQLVLPFAYFDTAYTGAFPKSPEDTIVYNNDLFIKATVDEKIVNYNNIPAALVTLSSIVEDTTGVAKIIKGNQDIIEKVHGAGAGANNAFDNTPAGRGADDAYGAVHKRRTPDAASVPMISNTDRYGPYGYQGPSGPVAFQAADNIVPWNYGGYDVMDTAAAEQSKDSVTYMQVGEKGSITFVGSPQHRLGQEIKSSIEAFANVAGQTTTISVGNGNTITFQKFPMYKWVGDLGPSITSINISIGAQGVTTTYTLSTFSPTFGKMAKYNANRLSVLGKRRQEIQRSNRDRQKLQKQLASAQGVANKAMAAAVKVQQAAHKNTAPGTTTVTSASINSGKAGTAFAGKKNSSTQSSSTSSLTNSTSQSGVAATSQDAFYVPVSKSGDSNLPRYAFPTSGCSGSGGIGTPGTTPQMDPPVAEWMEPITNISYLDPFYSPSNPKHTTEPITGLHHDVQIVAHGDPEDEPIIDMVVNEAEGNDFPEDFRMLAHKGPMLLHGWGYDTEGKPVPNFADDPTDARNGIFKSTGLRDTFLTGWLTNQETWPVAPIDLRFDRTRAVWTVPNQFRLGIAKASGSGTAILTNLSQTMDSDGEVISTGNITYKVPEGMEAPKSGETFFAFYDNVDCTYYPLLSSSSGGGGLCVMSSGCDASGSGDYEPDGTGYEFPSICDVENLVLGRGITLSTVCLSGSNTGTGGCASGLTNGSFMNDPHSGVHSAVIELDLNISGYSGFCTQEEQNLHGGLLESIQFGSGLILTKQTGENSGCEGDFIVDPILQRLSNFECSGTTGDFQDQVYSGLLFSTGILVEDSGDCTYAISSNIKISDSSGACDTGRVPTVTDKVFTHLTFGSGLLVSGDECDYTVHGVLPKITSTGWCEYSGNIDEQPFEHLRVGSGLSVSGTGCDYTVRAEHYIRDLEYCNWHASYTGYEFFTGLVIGTGLRVTGQGCEYGIDADHYISSTGGGCVDTGVSGSIADKGDKFFTNLVFGYGFNATSGDTDCKFNIESSRAIASGSGTDHSPFNTLNFIPLGLGVTTGVTECEYSIENTHTISAEACNTGTGVGDSGSLLLDQVKFENIKFGRGLAVGTDENVSDGYIVSTKIALDTIDYCDQSGASSGVGGTFERLTLGTGLILSEYTGTSSGLSGCAFTIDADHQIKSISTCGRSDQDSPQGYTFFNKLAFSSGLRVSGTDCEFTISSTNTISGESPCGGTETEGGFYENLVVSTGLKLSAGGEDCSYKISSDFKVGSSGVCGESEVAPENVSTIILGTGLSYEGGDCTGTISSNIKIKDTATCASTSSVEDYQLFSKLNFNSGITLEEAGDCEYKVNVNLSLEDEAVCGQASNVQDKPFRKITTRSGLVLTEAADCEYKLDVNLQVEDEATCGGTSAVGETTFRKITARSGLTLTAGADCEYKLDSNRTLSDIDSCTSDEVLSSKFFNNLTFHSGLSVEDFGDCNYGISAEHTISSTGSTLLDSESLNEQFFTNLSFTSGLGVKTLGPCSYEIFASGSGGAISYISNSGCGATGLSEQPTQHLVFSSGLDVVQNLDSTNSWIITGPKVSGIGSCGVQDWGGKPFSSLTFGSGFKNAGDDCDPIVDIERYISTSGECDTETIPEQFFKKLAFGTGLEVLAEGNCEFKISSSHKIKDDAYCGYTPSVANHTAYTKLNFGSGLKVTGTQCEFGIVADHTITDSAYCSHSPAITADSFFRNLDFKSGLQVTAGSDCSYEINVSRFVKDGAYCSYSPSVASDKQYFEMLTFGSGLKVSGGSCNFTIDADHRIKADSVCGSDAVADQLFRLLTFTTGLEVKDNGNCDFSISSSRRLSKTDCGGTLDSPSINNQPFNLLHFSTGIEVSSLGSCDYEIKAAHKISDSSYCSYSPSSPVSNKYFEHLEFGSGLKVVDGASCKYIIHSDHTIRDDGYCNHTPSVLDGTFLNKLVFGTGLKVTGSNCEYGISADHTISSTGTTLLQSQLWDDQFFRNLSFTSGLGVRALGDCSYEIWASGGEGGASLITNTGCGASSPNAQQASHFYFRSGLTVTDKTDEANAWFIDGPKISVEHCITPTYSRYKMPFDELVFSSGFSTGLNSTDCVPVIVGPRVSGLQSCIAQPGAGNWGGLPFETLIFGSGFHQAGGTDCNPIVHAPQYVSGSGDCNTFTDRRFFNELIFTTGTAIRDAGPGDDCRYIISGPKVSGMESCTAQSGAGNWGGYPFDTLIFGTGISKEGTDCNPIINAPQYVSGSGDCNTFTDRRFFNELIFTTGTTIRDAAPGDDCRYIISGPKVSGMESCTAQSGAGNWGGYPFDTLIFGTGISKEGTDCNPIINAPQYISGSGDCGNEFTRSFFNELIFTTGTNISSTYSGDNCSFIISGPRVSGLASCSLDAGAGDWGGKPFQQLVFGTGFEKQGTDCNPTIHAPQFVSGSGCDGLNDFPRTFFHDLIFTTGINIASTGGDDPCGFLISGPKISGEQWCTAECEGGDCVPMYTGSAPFSNLIVSTGLQLEESGCGTMVLASPMKVINSEHCVGIAPYKDLLDSNGESYSQLNVGFGLKAKHYPDECAHDIFLDIAMTGVEHYSATDCSPLSDWNASPEHVADIHAGPGVYITGRTSGCEAVIYTNLTIGGKSGTCPTMSDVSFSHIENIELGCGLRLEASSSTVCGDKKGVKISIDPDAGRAGISAEECHAGATGIKVVRDVCCTGEDLTVHYITLNFSDCGLFTHVTNDDGFCECEGC